MSDKIIDIKIRIHGSKKDQDIKKVMEQINELIFGLEDYSVLYTRIERGLIEKLFRLIR